MHGHSVKASALRSAYAVSTGPKTTKAMGKAWLTFVVPPDKFSAFRLQDTKRFRVQQHVFKMPLISKAARIVPLPALRCL